MRGIIKHSASYYKKKDISRMTKDMKRNTQNRNSDKLLTKYINKPGIALTFDDGFRVTHWYDYGLGKKQGYEDIFGYYDVKATFNINALHTFEKNRQLNQREIDMLLELQSNGHEIALHGYAHRNAVEYVEKFGLQSWINDEIVQLSDWMEKQRHSITGEGFKKSAAYAYPGSKYNNITNTLLSPRYIQICRGYLEGNNLISLQYNGLCPSICIDTNIFPYISQVRDILKIAQKNKYSLVLMCHSILPEDVNWEYFGWSDEAYEAGQYRISPKSLKYVIKEAKKLGFEFYTLSEIAGIATFIDEHMENYIRELLGRPKDTNKWIFIKDLINIKELDLSNKDIKNISGIEYFINLISLNIRHNSISNIGILKSLKNLDYIDMRNNPIRSQDVEELLNMAEKNKININF